MILPGFLAPKSDTAPPAPTPSMTELGSDDPSGGTAFSRVLDRLMSRAPDADAALSPAQADVDVETAPEGDETATPVEIDIADAPPGSLQTSAIDATDTPLPETSAAEATEGSIEGLSAAVTVVNSTGGALLSERQLNQTLTFQPGAAPVTDRPLLDGDGSATPPFVTAAMSGPESRGPSAPTALTVDQVFGIAPGASATSGGIGPNASVVGRATTEPAESPARIAAASSSEATPLTARSGGTVADLPDQQGIAPLRVDPATSTRQSPTDRANALLKDISLQANAQAGRAQGHDTWSQAASVSFQAAKSVPGMAGHATTGPIPDAALSAAATAATARFGDQVSPGVPLPGTASAAPLTVMGNFDRHDRLSSDRVMSLPAAAQGVTAFSGGSAANPAMSLAAFAASASPAALPTPVQTAFVEEIAALDPGATRSEIGASTGQSQSTLAISQAARAAPLTAPPPTAQIAQAVRTGGAGTIEISLSPEELGTVRISMQRGDGAMQVAIYAERDETMSLLRRHADDLDAAFRDLQLGHVDISFGQGDARDGRAVPSDEADRTDPAEPSRAAIPDHANRASRALSGHGARLDLKL